MQGVVLIVLVLTVVLTVFDTGCGAAVFDTAVFDTATRYYKLFILTYSLISLSVILH